MSATQRTSQLQAEIAAYQAEQGQLIGSLQGALADATQARWAAAAGRWPAPPRQLGSLRRVLVPQGRALDAATPADGNAVQQQISELTVLSSTRDYGGLGRLQMESSSSGLVRCHGADATHCRSCTAVVRLKAAAEEVKQLERQIRGAAAAVAEPQVGASAVLASPGVQAF